MSYAKYSNLGDNAPKPVDNATSDRFVAIITSAQQKEDFLRNSPITVVYIYADWCGPCKHVAPKYVDMAMKYAPSGKVVFLKEDVDKDISGDVNGVPTFRVYTAGGRMVKETVGADIEEVESVVNSLLQRV